MSEAIQGGVAMVDAEKYLQQIRALADRIKQLDGYCEQAQTMARKHLGIAKDAMLAHHAYMASREEAMNSLGAIQTEVMGVKLNSYGRGIDDEQLRTATYLARELGLPWDDKIKRTY